jgi:hypothetical protein
MLSIVKKLRSLHAIIVIATAVSLLSSHAQATEVADENAVKAAFLLNFSRYAEWPSENPRRGLSNFTICIWNDNDFTKAAKALEGKQLRGLAVSVKEVHATDQLYQCDTLFVSHNFKAEIPLIRNMLSQYKVLLVTDVSGAGALNFIVEQGKVRFDCNLDHAVSSGVRLSSQLIKLAINIIGEQQ